MSSPSDVSPLIAIEQILRTPFWSRWDFWISMFVSLVGIAVSTWSLILVFRVKHAVNQGINADRKQQASNRIEYAVSTVKGLGEKSVYGEIRNVLLGLLTEIQISLNSLSPNETSNIDVPLYRKIINEALVELSKQQGCETPLARKVDSSEGNTFESTISIIITEVSSLVGNLRKA